MKSEKLKIKNIKWKKIKADELCKKVTDGTHDTPRRLKDGYPLITSKQLTGGVISPTDYLISEHDFQEVNKRSKVDQWDLLFGMIGTIGEMVIVKDKNPQFAIKNIGLFKAGGDRFLAQWLYYYFKSPIGQAYIKSVTRGTSQGYIPLEALRNFPVLIPESREELKKIVSILSAFDEKIELNNRINKILEEMAQAIFDEWFVKFRFPGWEKAKFVDSELGKIPEELEFMAVDGALSIVKGFEPGSHNYSPVCYKEYIPFYRVKDLKNGGRAEVYIKKELAGKKITQETDVLISLDGTVGKVAIGCNGAYSSGIYRFSSNPQFNYIKSSFIYFFLKSSYVQNILSMYSDQGTTITHASHAVDDMWIPTNQYFIDLFQKISEPIFNEILKNIQENQKLAVLRDLLLPKLMSGEMRA